MKSLTRTDTLSILGRTRAIRAIKEQVSVRVREAIPSRDASDFADRDKAKRT